MCLPFFFSLSTLSSDYKSLILCIRGCKLVCISGVFCGYFACFFFDSLTYVCTIESGVSHPEQKFTLLEWGRPVKVTMLWMRRCV